MSATPLTGLRVLDLTRYLPGPYCTLLLAALGADVVKVEEPPCGDLTRAVPPAFDGESVTHAVLNRHKRSIVVDLRQPDGAALLRRLALACDVLVDGFRPGTLERRGLGAATLRAQHPRLVYCALSGYGSHGPLAAHAGHDIDYAARAGLLDLNRDAQGTPHLPAYQAADLTGGLLATIAVLAALQGRERSGVGQLVDVSLLGGALALAGLTAARRRAGASQADELAGAAACYRPYRCSDGRYLVVGALEPKFWERLCLEVGLPELVGRQWDRGPRAAEVSARLEALFANRPRDTWVSELAAADVCVEPLLETDEALDQEQAAPYRVEDAIAGRTLRAMGVPFLLDGCAPAAARPAPGLGQHTDEVLGELGLPADEIAALRAAGVVQ